MLATTLQWVKRRQIRRDPALPREIRRCGISPARCRLQPGAKGTWCSSARGVEEDRKPRVKTILSAVPAPKRCLAPATSHFLGSRCAPTKALPGGAGGEQLRQRGDDRSQRPETPRRSRKPRPGWSRRLAPDRQLGATREPQDRHSRARSTHHENVRREPSRQAGHCPRSPR